MSEGEEVTKTLQRTSKIIRNSRKTETVRKVRLEITTTKSEKGHFRGQKKRSGYPTDIFLAADWWDWSIPPSNTCELEAAMGKNSTEKAQHLLRYRTNPLRVTFNFNRG